LPYYKECKSKSYELLRLGNGMSVLEAGCGIGDDAIRMAEFVMPDGKVIGLDSSSAMIEKARSRQIPAGLNVRFQTGDVKALPFPDNSFSRCRIDRVLQHIREPEKAVSELVRVLEPDGLLLAYDNDWNSFSVTSRDLETARTLENLWCDSFTSPRIGLDLCGYFMSRGLTDIQIFPGVSAIRDFETADRVYNLRETAQRAVAAGIISADRGQAWMDELIPQSEKGSFIASLTAYTVVGRKKART
jgi:ubiquinone/menaquinone biosynthesis C-methylase UbiE